VTSVLLASASALDPANAKTNAAAMAVQIETVGFWILIR
jgi:hypothetical protein